MKKDLISIVSLIIICLSFIMLCNMILIFLLYGTESKEKEVIVVGQSANIENVPDPKLPSTRSIDI